MSDDTGDLTEVDDDALDPSPPRSPLRSAERDAGPSSSTWSTSTEEAAEPNSTAWSAEEAVEPSPTPWSTEEASEPIPTTYSPENIAEPSSITWHTEEATEPNPTTWSFDSTMSSFDSAFSYTEDVKMFPDSMPEDPSPTPEPSQAPHQTLMHASEGTTASPNGLSLKRLRMYDTDSKPQVAFGMAPPATDLIPQYAPALPYGYPSYLPMVQAAFPLHETNGFEPCGSVQSHGISPATAHGLLDGSQLQGLPMQQLPRHSFPTHGLPLAMDWVDQI